MQVLHPLGMSTAIDGVWMIVLGACMEASLHLGDSCLALDGVSLFANMEALLDGEGGHIGDDKDDDALGVEDTPVLLTSPVLSDATSSDSDNFERC